MQNTLERASSSNVSERTSRLLHADSEFGRRSVLLIGALLLFSALSACGNNDDTDPVSLACTPGTPLCECVQGGCPGGPGLACVDDLCIYPGCDVGEEECACNADGSCGLDWLGRQLVCDLGTCVAPACSAGTLGCECAAGSTCGDGLTCTEDICLQEECLRPGLEDCACNADRSCDAGLACVLGQCTAIGDGCEVGAGDCPCRRDGGCDAGFACDTSTDTCVAIECTPGTIGCTCDDGMCSAPDSTCTDGRCEIDDCPAGLEGCECRGDACGVNDRGEQLVCSERSICETASCTVGSPGCACVGGETCDGGASCLSGFCVLDGCAPGDQHCACSAGGCDAGLACRADTVCVDGTGYAGGACFDDGTCAYGNRCVDGLCATCLVGTVGCQCNADAVAAGSTGCGVGAVCTSWGECVASSELVQDIPERPFCVTPCNAASPECPSTGFIEGCTAGNECVEGSCVAPGESPPSCTMDSECPAHQACLSGGCYSTCRGNSACGGGTECHLFTCRQTCAAGTDTCPSDTFCELQDAANGYCMPEVPGADGELVLADGVVVVEPTVLPMTNSSSRQEVRIFNDTGSTQRFTVRKLDHQQLFDDGSRNDAVDFDDDEACDVARGECPLFWLEIGQAGDPLARIEGFDLVVEAGEEATIVIDGAGDSSAVRWTGTIEIVSREVGSTQVALEYTERPDGAWRGTMFTYTQFYEDETIDAWAATPATRNDATLQDQLSNAFLQRWGAFRRGDLSWEEMQAVMLATESGAWESASELPECGVEACYLYGGRRTGVGDYSSDLDRIPIPTGVTELPFAMNIYQPNPISDPGRMEGRIDSAGTLHYAGNPALSLRFETAPEACDEEAFGSCLSYIESMESEILVGGRYRSAGDDASCAARADGTFESVMTPWLLPDFQTDTTVEDGVRARYECRDTLLPFDTEDPIDGDENVLFNLGLAASNPVPDGRSRERSLELLDGVLVNQTEMVLIVRERMDSFHEPDDEEGIAAYGYIVLRRQPTDLGDDEDLDGVIDAYEGNVVVDTRPEPDFDPLALSCDPGLLDEVLLPGETLSNDAHAARVISRLIHGIDTSLAGDVLDNGDDETAHYLCVDTGLIDGGADNTTASGAAFSRNDNSCATARNGVCEDGGWNASRVAVDCDEDARDDDCLTPLTLCSLGTDLQDCGVRESADRDFRETCPAASEVIYFTVDSRELSQADIASLPCQLDGSCGDTYREWVSSYASSPLIQVEALFRCTNGGAYCSANRQDLRFGKEFFAATETDALLPSFRSLVDSAFRYRTRFRARDGDLVGFAPEICLPDSEGIPYCYSPADIEPLVDRVDCLLWLWSERSLEMQGSGDPNVVNAVEDLQSFLAFNFSLEQACIDGSETCDCAANPAQCRSFDGFERLYAELLIMMGDDAYTDAFSSRFDLAGSRTSSFEGTLFEYGGINLSGVAGNEMVSLYRAIQYYSEVLDRFYSLSPFMWRSVEEYLAEQERPLEDHRLTFVEPEMVTTYMERLLRASTQRSRAWSAIATRYQSFGQTELARRVIERAYTSTYLESVAIARLMQRIRETFNELDRPQIDQVIESAALRYGMALLEMRTVYSSINDQTTFFGLDPDFIPFPVMNAGNFQADTAFEVIFRRAQERMEVARAREDLAIASSRSYETDAEQFQSELIRIRNTYESQLGDLCGTFEAADGRIYPAIRRYASLDRNLALLGDPCGLAGNGTIFEELIGLDLIGVELQQLQERYSAVFQRIEIERNRVDEQCGLIEDTANYTLCLQTGDRSACDALPADAELPPCPESAGRIIDEVSDVTEAIIRGRLEEAGPEVVEGFYGSECSVMSLEQEIRESRNAQRISNTAMSTVSNLASLAKCFVLVGTSSGSDCAGAALGTQMILGSAAVNETIQTTTQFAIDANEREITSIQYMIGHFQTVGACDQLRVDSEARVREMMLELNQLDLESLRIQYQIQLALSRIERLNNEAQRLQLEQQETEQLTINVEAARNDPNVRIYRNDAVINADYAFESAMALAYQATRIYEYYTTSSYAARDQLFLIRLVGSGDYNLENYLLDLQDAFFAFEEDFGAPDLRVEILSLRDDLLQIPLVDERGIPLSQNERVSLLRERLADPTLLDANGYLTIPFSTDTGALSPLTRAHRTQFIEADIIASDYGDEVGRVYLRQLGTASLDRIGGGTEYFRFPRRNISVVDAFFGGTRYFDPEVYRSYTFLDRPFANTAWELVINQRDEEANRDIDLQSLTDIRLYVYYNDFTVYE